MALVEIRTVVALRVRAKHLPAHVTVNGAPCTPQRLGHNAPQRGGWHPYVIVTPIEPTYGEPLVLTVEAPGARFSQLLVTLVSTTFVIPPP